MYLLLLLYLDGLLVQYHILIKALCVQIVLVHYVDEVIIFMFDLGTDCHFIFNYCILFFLTIFYSSESIIYDCSSSISLNFLVHEFLFDFRYFLFNLKILSIYCILQYWFFVLLGLKFLLSSLFVLIFVRVLSIIL